MPAQVNGQFKFEASKDLALQHMDLISLFLTLGKLSLILASFSQLQAAVDQMCQISKPIVL